MRLTRADRMEMIERMIQDKIQNAEKQLESLGTMPDVEICRMRNMYLLDLGELRANLISIRNKLDIEYSKNRSREEFHEQIKSFAEGGHVGGYNEENLRRRRLQEQLPDGGGSGGVSYVGRDGADLPGDGQGDRCCKHAGHHRGEGIVLRDWQIEEMMERARKNAGMGNAECSKSRAGDLSY